MLWSYLLAAVGLLGLFLAGRGKRLGWAVGIGAQCLWAPYAIVTQQYGFLVTAAAYAGMYAWNWWTWKRKGPEADLVAEVARRDRVILAVLAVADSWDEAARLTPIGVPQESDPRADQVRAQVLHYMREGAPQTHGDRGQNHRVER